MAAPIVSRYFTLNKLKSVVSIVQALCRACLIMPGRGRGGGGKHKTLSLAEKVELIEEHEKEKRSPKELVEKFKVGKTQVYDTLKNKDKIMDEWLKGTAGQIKRFGKVSSNEEINKAVWEWFVSARAIGMPISGPIIQAEALDIAQKLGKTDFKASNGWLESFRSRHNVVFNEVRVQKIRTARAVSSQAVTSKDENGARWITLTNPKRRNVLSFDVLKQLKKELDITVASTPLHCVVIRAEGNVFSAGHDLKELTSASADKHREIFDLCAQVMLSIENLPVPVVAQVRGLATAAGCQLAASCDIIVASENATFTTPGVRVGLFCSTPGIPVVRTLPLKVAKYMLFTGLPITAKEASNYGLVSRVVSDENLTEETMKIVKAICETSLPVQAMGKRFLQKQIELTTKDAYKEATNVMVENLRIEDAQTGIEAFANKIKPKWSHSDKKVH